MGRAPVYLQRLRLCPSAPSTVQTATHGTFTPSIRVPPASLCAMVLLAWSARTLASTVLCRLLTYRGHKPVTDSCILGGRSRAVRLRFAVFLRHWPKPALEVIHGRLSAHLFAIRLVLRRSTHVFRRALRAAYSPASLALLILAALRSGTGAVRVRHASKSIRRTIPEPQNNNPSASSPAV